MELERTERRNRPRPRVNMEDDVLRLHLVIGAALSGRTTDDHAHRAARQAHRWARRQLWPASCAVCGEPAAQPGRPVWIIWQGQILKGSESDARLYCSEAHAARQLWRAEPIERPCWVCGGRLEQLAVLPVWGGVYVRCSVCGGEAIR